MNIFTTFQRNIERALPIIHRDVDSTLMNLGLKTEEFLREVKIKMGPYVTEAGKKGDVLWTEIQRRNDLVIAFFHFYHKRDFYRTYFELTNQFL